MAHMIRAMKKWELTFDEKTERLIFKHPLLGFVGMFVGVPLFILIAVGVSTTAVMLPVSWLLGWL